MGFLNDRGFLNDFPSENSYSDITGGLSSWLNCEYMHILTRSLNPLSEETFKKMAGPVERIMKSILNDSGLRDMDISSFCNSLRYSHFPKIITLIGQEIECRFWAKDGFNVDGIIIALRQNIAKCFESVDDTISILTRSMTEKCFGGSNSIEEECFALSVAHIDSIDSFSAEENCVQNALNNFALQCVNNTFNSEDFNDADNTNLEKMFFGYHGITSTLAGLSDSVCAETFSGLWDQWKEWNAPKFNDTIIDEENLYSIRILPEEEYQFSIAEYFLMGVAGVAALTIAAKYGGSICSKAKGALLDCINYAGYEGLRGQGQSVEYYADVDQAGGEAGGETGIETGIETDIETSQV